MTPRERAYLIDADLTEGDDLYGQAERLAKIAFGIMIDRQALQAEIVKEIELRKGPKDWSTQVMLARDDAYMACLAIVRGIFAQQSWPDVRPHQFQGSRDRWCEICDQPDRAEIHVKAFQQAEIDKRLQWEAGQETIPITEAARRVLEEREACAKAVEEFGKNGEWQYWNNPQCGIEVDLARSMIALAQIIRARSNPVP